MPKLEFRKTKDFFRTKGELNCRAYNVYAKDGVFGNKSFAFLYVDIESFTIAWNGFIDFSVIEKVVLQDLPNALFPQLHRIQPSNSTIKSLFTFSGTTNEPLDFMVQYDYNDDNPEKTQEFNQLIHSRWREALYARYDIINHQDYHNIRYSFTTENRHHPRVKHKFCELAIKQPITQELSIGLFEWVYNCHSERSYYKNHLNTNVLREEFNKFIFD